MEVIGITTTHVLTKLPCGRTTLIRAQEIDENHPLIRDRMSYRLGVIAAMNTIAANDSEDEDVRG